jgi:hypothetical protein
MTYAMVEQSQFLDSERGREKGLEQFVDKKSFRPGWTATRAERRRVAPFAPSERPGLSSRAMEAGRNIGDARAAARGRAGSGAAFGVVEPFGVPPEARGRVSYAEASSAGG